MSQNFTSRSPGTWRVLDTHGTSQPTDEDGERNYRRFKADSLIGRRLLGPAHTGYSVAWLLRLSLSNHCNTLLMRDDSDDLCASRGERIRGRSKKGGREGDEENAKTRELRSMS